MTLAKNIRYLRKANNLSQEDIARKLNYKSFTTIQKWEEGTSEPSLDILKELSKMFGVSLEGLVNFDYENLEHNRSDLSDPEVVEIAERLHKTPGMRTLFSLAKNVTPEDLKLVEDMLRRMKKDSGYED
jgi:transcriptional regulator with XRE-family HTH domain